MKLQTVDQRPNEQRKQDLTDERQNRQRPNEQWKKDMIDEVTDSGPEAK